MLRVQWGYQIRLELAIQTPGCPLKKQGILNSGLAIVMESVFKGSGASNYLEITPNFALEEHYIHTTHKSLNQFG